MRWLRSPPELRGGGPELPGAWLYLSPLTWGAEIQSCKTRDGAWMLDPPLVLTLSLYAGVPDLQGTDSGPRAHLRGGCESPGGVNIFLPALLI
jgi:hypothetical protein